MNISEPEFKALLVYIKRERGFNKSLQSYQKTSPAQYQEHENQLNVLRALNTKLLIRNNKRIV